MTGTATAGVGGLLAGAVSSPESAVFGIAVTGLSGKGTWLYDRTGLGNFAILSGVSPTTALLLPASAVLKFVPADSSVAQVATLSYKAWDVTNSGQLSAGSKVSTTGATTKNFFSTAVETLNVNIGNHAPVLAPL